MERRFNQTTVRSAGSKIVGTASVTYDGTPGTEYCLWEGCVERIAPGAFDEHLRQKPDVVALYNHDANMILGRVSNGRLKLSTDSSGLHYEIDPTDTSYSRDLRTNIAEGNVTGSSFAMVPQEVEWTEDGDKDVRLIRKATLHDVSPVTNPAYGSTASSLRSEDRKALQDEKNLFETIKREAILHRYLNTTKE